MKSPRGGPRKHYDHPFAIKTDRTVDGIVNRKFKRAQRSTALMLCCPVILETSRTVATMCILLFMRHANYSSTEDVSRVSRLVLWLPI